MEWAKKKSKIIFEPESTDFVDEQLAQESVPSVIRRWISAEAIVINEQMRE